MILRWCPGSVSNNSMIIQCPTIGKRMLVRRQNWSLNKVAEIIKWLRLLPFRESADKVVLHTGKYEELIVCSHEIAASTAQLVAASKVRKYAPKCWAVVF